MRLGFNCVVISVGLCVWCFLTTMSPSCFQCIYLSCPSSHLFLSCSPVTLINFWPVDHPWVHPHTDTLTHIHDKLLTETRNANSAISCYWYIHSVEKNIQDFQIIDTIWPVVLIWNWVHLKFKYKFHWKSNTFKLYLVFYWLANIRISYSNMAVLSLKAHCLNLLLFCMKLHTSLHKTLIFHCQYCENVFIPWLPPFIC